MQRDVQIPILMYHEVAEGADIERLSRKTQRSYICSTDEFEQQMGFLRQDGFNTISLDDLVRFNASDGTAIPAKPVVITFDDGFAGNVRHALPTLVRNGQRATFFVVTNKVGDADMMSWGDLRELQRHGMSVQSHTANHPLLSMLDAGATRRELAESKAAIEDGVGSPVHFLSLPNGDSNPHYEPVARELGYRGGCCSAFGFNRALGNPFFFRRIAVKGGMSPGRFRGIVQRDVRTLAWLGARSVATKAVARLISKRVYDRLYNVIYGVEEQDKSKRP